MKILFDILGLISIIGAMFITVFTVTIMSDTVPLMALVSALAAAGYLYLVLYTTKDEKSIWATKAISGFFLLLFINFIGCSGIMQR